MKKLFWWRGMKRGVCRHVNRCVTCQQIKADHQKVAGLLQPLEIPNWKFVWILYMVCLGREEEMRVYR